MVGGELGGEEDVELMPIAFAKGGDFEAPFQEAMLADPGMFDAGLLAAFGGADHGEFAPGMVEVPRDEAELAGVGLEVHEVVLAVTEEAIVIGKENLAGQKSGEGVKVHISSDL